VSLNDGLFELLLVPNPRSPLELQELVWSLLQQDYQGKGMIFRHVSRLRVQTPEHFPWALDGEYDAGGETVVLKNLERRLTFLL
jgi:diacylglycerol kinase family enzyme